MASTDKLYTAEVLALATALARWPLNDDLKLRGEARSPTCGSTIELALSTDPSGAVTQIGLRARACAIGQASAAIFAEAADGHDKAAVIAALSAIESWLAGGALPDWPGIGAIAAARDFPARHGAISLPWRAALVALGQPG